MHTYLLPIIIGLMALAAEAKSVPKTHQSLTNLMVEVRDPFFNSAKRTKYLELTQTEMKKKMARELGTTTDTLAKTFITNPDSLDILWASPWNNLLAEFYTTLHQETLHRRWKTKTEGKKITDYGKGLADSMIFHLGKYSGVKEGRVYNRWHNVSLTQNGKKKNFRVPFFVFAPNTETMLSLDAHTGFENLFPKADQETSINPSLSTFLRNAPGKTREEYQDLAEKIQLNQRIYIRAVANAAKTVASVHYLTGEYTLTQTESKVTSFLSGFCDGCSSKELKDYKTAAITYVTKTKRELSREYANAGAVAQSFCHDLRTNGYLFEEPKKEETDPYLQHQYVAVQDNTRVDMTHVQMQVLRYKLEALQKTIYEHDLGVLFLTNSLSQLSAQYQPMGSVLQCRPQTLAADTAVIKKAIIEARQNVEKYISHVNSKVQNSIRSSKAVTETLEYFTQTNVSATSEAVMMFPQGIPHVVNSMYELDRDVKRRKRTDKIVAWGGTIVGVALTISGIGAPEGVAILLAVGSMAKGVISGSYNLYRSQQEKVFHRELQIAMSGLGKNFYLNDNLHQHYNDYRNLRMSYIVDFAGSAISFAKIHKMALTKGGGDVAKSHSILKKAMERLKALSEDFGESEITEKLVELMT